MISTRRLTSFYDIFDILKSTNDLLLSTIAEIAEARRAVADSEQEALRARRLCPQPRFFHAHPAATK